MIEVLALATGLIGGVVVGLVVGTRLTINDERKSAADAGVARWSADPNTGKLHFYYLTEYVRAGERVFNERDKKPGGPQ